MATVLFKSVEFEVFGRVQGVFFRKSTKRQAEQLGLVGWVKNTSQGTVIGIAQGPDHKLDIMKHWLSKVGSKASRIENCHFNNEKTLQDIEYRSFEIKK